MEKVTKRMFRNGSCIQHVVVGEHLALVAPVSRIYMRLLKGTDGYPVEVQFVDRGGKTRETLALNECADLSDFPRMLVDTSLIVNAIAGSLFSKEPMDIALRELFSVIAARAATLTIELDDDDGDVLDGQGSEDADVRNDYLSESGEVVFTLTCGTYRSEVKRSLRDVVSIVAFVPIS